MLILALSNLRHHIVRSLLSILAVSIAITLLLVLLGLSQGTLNEISDRMESVNAEIVVKDRHFDLGSMSGGKLWEKEITRIQSIHISGKAAVRHVIPVFLGRIKLGGLSQNVFGVHPADFTYFAGQRRIMAGTLFRDMSTPAAAMQETDRALKNGTDDAVPLPLVIDTRLSRASHLKVGDKISFGDFPAEITGIVQTGVAGRVFAPINQLRAVNGVAARTAHLFFVKARSQLSTGELYELCRAIEQKTHRQATLVANYSQVLKDNFRNLTVFVGLVSVIALVICFLFILVTIHTSVLERRKEIAILQSLGAGARIILGETVQEAVLICLIGTMLGIAAAVGVKYLIETFQPLMTVEMRISWVILAVFVGLAGGVLSALYPGYVALKRDPVEALCFD